MEIKFWEKPTIGDIIQIILILCLFCAIVGFKMAGYYDSIYISYRECDNIIGVEKINRMDFLNDKAMIPFVAMGIDGDIVATGEYEFETFKVNKSTLNMTRGIQRGGD